MKQKLKNFIGSEDAGTGLLQRRFALSDECKSKSISRSDQNKNSTSPSIRWNENETCLLISGAFNFADVVKLRQLGSKLVIQSIHPVITIDLQGVEHSDNSGLVLLVAWMRDARRQGKSLIFSHVPEFLVKMAQVFGLQTILFSRG